MNTIQRNEFREVIHERLQRIGDRCADLRGEIGKSNGSQPMLAANYIAHAAEESNLVDQLQLHATLLNERRELQGALFRIERGDFGICSECEEEIDVRRLRAMPGALRCVECAEFMRISTGYGVKPPNGLGLSVETLGKGHSDENSAAS